MLRFTTLRGGGARAKAVSQYVQSERKEPRKEKLKLNERGQQLATGYYSEQGGAPSQWIAGEEIGFSGKPDAKQLESLLSGIAPDDTDLTDRGNQKENHRMGYDLTFGAPKSVSMLMADDDRILDAQDRAIAKTVERVKTLAYARIGKGGEQTEYTNCILAAGFRHEDGRVVDGNADPHLHTHVIVLNMTKRSDGTWVALRIDWGENNINQHLIDNIYKTELARELKSLGYKIEITKDGFEIAGISREQIERFSRRAGQILDNLSEHGIENASSAQREAAQNATRAEKSQLSKMDQHFEWREALREAGISAEKIREFAKTHPQQELTPDQALDSAIHHLSERDTLFSRAELENAALGFGMGSVTVEQIQQAMENNAELLDVGLRDRDGTGKLIQRFTTREALHREAEIMDRARQGKDQATAILPSAQQPTPQPQLFSPVTKKEQHHGSKEDHQARHYQSHPAYSGPYPTNHLRRLSGSTLDANIQRSDSGFLSGNGASCGYGNQPLRRAGDGRAESLAGKELLDAREQAQGWKFSQGQRAAVGLALTSEDRHMGIVGAAGAGKTTSMKIVVEQYKAAGYSVIGVAPSAAAAKELESAGCESRTLASVLKDKEPQSARTLYLLDEAGMVSAKDYQAFFAKADREGARTLSVGDPLQLQSVEAGTTFKQLLESGSLAHVKIDEIQRQKDPQLKAIANAFAKGDAKRGVALAKPYMTQIRVEKGEDRTEKLAQAAAARYLSLAPEDRANTLLLASTNATRQAANAAIRAGLIERGELDPNQTVTVTALDKTNLSDEQRKHAQSYVPGMVIDVGTSKDREYRTVDHIEGGKLIDEKGTKIDPRDVRQAYQPRQMQVADGEQILFRQNDRERGIVNGSVGTVRILDGQAAVRLQNGMLVPLSGTEVADYAYARTIHSAQGATFEKAIVIGEASKVAGAEAAYVACSREKTGLEILTNDTAKLAEKWEKYAARETAHHALGLEPGKAPDKLPQLREDLPSLDRQAAERARAKVEQDRQQQERARQERERQKEKQKAAKQKGMDR